VKACIIFKPRQLITLKKNIPASTHQPDEPTILLPVPV
jgi:hypothetical protein